MRKRRDEAPPAADSDAGLALRTALFDRLAPALGNRTRLLIAPDGDLTRLPFEVLPTAAGRRLIDDYQISYLSCGRDVLRFGAAPTGQPGRSLVVADPDFDLKAMITTGPVSAQTGLWSHLYLEAMATTGPASAKPGFWSRLLRRGKKATATPTQQPRHLQPPRRSPARPRADRPQPRRLPFPPTAGTCSEGTDRHRSTYPPGSTTQPRGRSTACHSPRILHPLPAFLLHQEQILNREGRGPGFDFGEFSGAKDGLARLSGPMMENPMLRSGLALAGANTWLNRGELPEEAEGSARPLRTSPGWISWPRSLWCCRPARQGWARSTSARGSLACVPRVLVLAGAKTLV